MRRRFRPVLTELEGRQMLSSMNHHLSGGARIETRPKPGAGSITGTLNGTFECVAPPGSSPSSDYMQFRFFSGQLNAIPMGGTAGISVNTSGLDGIANIFILGKFQGPFNGRPPLDLKPDLLTLKPLDAPFLATDDVPSSFNLLTRVKSATGVFKRDVHKLLSLTIVLSDQHDNGAYVNADPTVPFELSANVTATVQPAET
jgi:hypothetical protein